MLFFFYIRGKLGVIRSIQELIFIKCLIYFFLRFFATFAVKGVLRALFMSHTHFNLLKPLCVR